MKAVCSEMQNNTWRTKVALHLKSSLYWNIKSVLFQPPHSIMPVLHYSTQRNMFYENVFFIISRVYVLVITYFYNDCKFYYDIYYLTNINFVLKTFAFPNLYTATLLRWKLNLLAFAIMTSTFSKNSFKKKFNKKLNLSGTNKR